MQVKSLNLIYMIIWITILNREHLSMLKKNKKVDAIIPEVSVVADKHKLSNRTVTELFGAAVSYCPVGLPTFTWRRPNQQSTGLGLI